MKWACLLGLGFSILGCESVNCPDNYRASTTAYGWAIKMKLPDPTVECGGSESDCHHAICNIAWNTKHERRVETFYCDVHNCVEYK
jgi:hypothetical protein